MPRKLPEIAEKPPALATEPVPPGTSASVALPATEAASEAWKLGWAKRGIYFSEQLGANLPANFPVIDNWLNSVVTSIKSIDLRAVTYQDAKRLTYRLNEYVDKLAVFDGASFDGWEIESTAIDGRVLSLAIPKGSTTAAQRTAIEAAKVRAQAFGVDLAVTPF